MITSDYNLRVKSISSAKNNGVRGVLSVDLHKIKDSIELNNAGLKLEEKRKVNPRLLIQEIPGDLSRDEIRVHCL